MLIWGCDYRAQLQYSLKCSLNESTQRMSVALNSSHANWHMNVEVLSEMHLKAKSDASLHHNEILDG